MSKNETPLTLAYWNRIGGTLIEEFPAVRRTKEQGQRLVDAIILPNGPNRRLTGKERRNVDIDGQDVIVVQTKTGRIGMYLMGQALFSRVLLRRFHNPKTVRTVALCERWDAALGPIAEEWGIEVVLLPDVRAGG